MTSQLISLADVASLNLSNADRPQLTNALQAYKDYSDEWMRRQIVVHNRIDILSREVLNYKVEPFHLSLLQYQFRFQDTLQLAPRGFGKCLGRGTPVLMADGQVKPVEDVVEGDQLMGPDSEPRTVRALSSGLSNLYRITPIKGDPWICNGNHLITVYGRAEHEGEVREFTPEQLIAMGRSRSRGTKDIPWKLWRRPVRFEPQTTPVDPYWMGLWLGDGCVGTTRIVSCDQEIIDWVAAYGSREGYKVKIAKTNTAKYVALNTYVNGHSSNPLLSYVNGIGATKRIPSVFLRNGEAERLSLLAGLLDSDGHLVANTVFEITQKRKELAQDIVYLARSLGFAAYMKAKKATIKSTSFEGAVYRICISGDTHRIPCKLSRKQASQRTSPKNVLVTGFTVEPVGTGEFFGFEVDRDHRFLLGDFTVTHNSTVCTIAKVIHLLCCNRDLRILLASKTSGNAENFLKEIKGHLENNERLIALFGKFYDAKKCRKWTDTEIDVLGRKTMTKESTVTCLGVSSAIVSRHFDVIISDDLVDEENARTPLLRDKTKTWYYQTLLPTLEPPDGEVRFRGEHHRLGTRYHYDDLWGHLQDNELKDSFRVIKALCEVNGIERSPWPMKFSVPYLQKLRKNMGTIIFNAQYQNDCDAMKGEVFRYDDCIQLPNKEWPDEKTLKIFMGVDLAIKESETTDQFAIVVIGVAGKIGSGAEKFYILDYYAGQLRFSEQTSKIIKMYDAWKPILGLVEANAYQLAQVQELKRQYPDMRIRPYITDKDKMTRAWKLSPLFEDGRVFFKKDGMGPLIDQLVLFPNHRYKDLFDALDLSVMAVKRRNRNKPERREPGVI